MKCTYCLTFNPEIDELVKHWPCLLYWACENYECQYNVCVCEFCQVSGILAPKPVSSFAHFNFDDRLMKAVRKAGYCQPTPIQAQVCTVALSLSCLLLWWNFFSGLFQTTARCTVCTDNLLVIVLLIIALHLDIVSMYKCPHVSLSVCLLDLLVKPFHGPLLPYGTAIKHPVPDQVTLSFVIFDTSIITKDGLAQDAL